MQKNPENFSMQDALRMAGSPAGQKLLALLQGSDNEKLQRAADQAAAGNYEGAKEALVPLLNSPQIQELLKQMGG